MKFALLFIAIFTAIFFIINPTKIEIPTNIVTAPMASPIPFSEMTIPTLSTRKYESSLGEMKKYSENSSYTSYLTSYTSDGLKVNGLLTVPKGSNERYPAIIFIHGYIPPESYRTTERYTDHIDYFARNGFVVFKVDLRGHGDSEGEPGGGYYSSDYVIDTLNAYKALEGSSLVNPENIGLWGHSMAGNIVLRALAAKPEIKAAVVWAGAGYTYTDLQEYMIEDNSYRPPPPDSERQRKRELLRQLYGNFDPNHEFWKQVTPINYLGNIKAAIEVHHATNDNVVSVEYGRNIMSILDKTNIVHQLYEYPSGGHNITGASFTQAMNRSIEFFKKYL